MKRKPFTMADARMYVREWIVKIPNLELLRSFFMCLDKGDRFTSDVVTHNGELTVTGDTSLDGPQTKIAGLFTSARQRGWIKTMKPSTSVAPRRHTSILHEHDVMARGQLVAPLLLVACDELAAELLED